MKVNNLVVFWITIIEVKKLFGSSKNDLTSHCKILSELGCQIVDTNSVPVLLYCLKSGR